MNYSLHCGLCSHQKMDFHTGTICGLINAKPTFKSKCRDILLEGKLGNQIALVNLEYESTKRLKSRAFTQSATALTISLLLLFGSYILNVFILEAGYIASLPIIVFGSGLLTLGTAFGPLVTFKRKVDVVKSKIKSLDEVLKLYSIQYMVNFAYHKEMHHEQIVDVKLEFSVKGQTRSVIKTMLIRPEGIHSI